MVCKKQILYNIGFAIFVIGCMLLLPVDIVQAAQQQAAEEGGYLASYQSDVPREEASWLSTIAYVFTLLFAFAIVLILAYLASRFLGQKMGGFQFAKSSKILETLPLGANRFLYVVEIAGRVMILGVTNNHVNLISEITDELEIAKLRTDAANMFANDSFNRLFEKQVFSLEQMAHKFPGLFGNKERK